MSVSSPPWRQAPAWLIAALAVLVAGLLGWPLWRAGLVVHFDLQEGWVAGYALESAQGGPLYPGPERLATNNYPPLHFILVGWPGVWLGDPIRFGRFAAIAALLALAVEVAAIVRLLGGGRMAAALAALALIGTIAKSATAYVGMNDPQLVAHALVMAGVAAVLAARARLWPVLLGVALMILAGFFKHNILAIPAATMLWLLVRRRGQFAPAAACALGLGALGVASCVAAFGPDFLRNLDLPRDYSVGRLLRNLGVLQAIAPALILWPLVRRRLARDEATDFIDFAFAASLLLFLVLRLGEGIRINALFEAMIMGSIALGLAFERIAALDLFGRKAPAALRAIVAGAVLLRLALVPSGEAMRVWFDPAFRAALRTQEAATLEDIAWLRAHPGPLFCESLSLCVWAGRRIDYDPNTVGLRLPAGVIDGTAVNAQLGAIGFAAAQTHPTTRFDAIVAGFARARESVNGVFWEPAR